jgi:two-component system, sensor histidine kinase
LKALKVPTVVEINFDLSRLKVLVAEDNLMNQKIITLFLKKLNIIPIVLENGKLAVEECDKIEFDIVFMDHLMPIMNGVDATKLILEKHKKKPPVMVAVSANALVEDRRLFNNTGFHEILPKPYTFLQFNNLLNNIFKISHVNEEKAS